MKLSICIKIKKIHGTKYQTSYWVLFLLLITLKLVYLKKTENKK